MTNVSRSIENDDTSLKIEELRQRLNEANDTIDAIRSGQVDALIVNDNKGPKLYTLKSADQTYRVFIEKMTEGAVTLNNRGIILYSNSRFASMLRLPLEKIIGSYFSDYVSIEDATKFLNLFESGWKEESKGELYLTMGDGQLIPVLLSLNTLDLDDGIALSLILTDLTSQKNIEKELRENNKLLEQASAFTEQLNNELELRVDERTKELLTSREHFKFLADTIPVIVWTALPNGEFDYFNRQWFDFTGIKPQDATKDDWRSVIHPDDLATTLSEWAKSIETGLPFKREDRKRSRHGVYLWHLVKALPLKDRNKKIIAWFGVCTEKKKKKRDMQKKDEFISMASHELKTPVTSLKAYTEILKIKLEEENNLMAVTMLTKMNRQIDKLTHLIGDLLDVSKANAGMLNYNFEDTDFNELVKDVVVNMQLTSTNHQIEMNLAETTVIECDKNRLGQVIINILSNAMKYSPRSGKIEVTSVKREQDVSLYIQDYGIGIPLDQQSKLFSRFFRVTENTFPGLGLGLYISNEIIKRHSGSMSFTSEEGKGSTFGFTLPIKNR